MICFHFALVLVFIFTLKTLGKLLYFLEFQVMSSMFIVFEMCFPNKSDYFPFTWWFFACESLGFFINRASCSGMTCHRWWLIAKALSLSIEKKEIMKKDILIVLYYNFWSCLIFMHSLYIIWSKNNCNYAYSLLMAFSQHYCFVEHGDLVFRIPWWI